MRRILVPALLSLAVVVPAGASLADPIATTCQSGDYQVVRVEAAGREIVEVCTSSPPPDVTVNCHHIPDVVCVLLSSIST